MIAESIMLFLNRHLPYIYAVIAILFFIGLCLRILDIYPGKKEPLFLDASAAVMAAALSWLSKTMQWSNIRFFLIVCSSVIILPHILYILQKKDI